MFALHIENKVENYENWKTGFDTYNDFRRDNGVLAYRVSRHAHDPHLVYVDLDFATRDEAAAFIEHLDEIRRTPQSRAAVLSYQPPELRDVTDQRTLR
ncbi:hypothetical protein [Rhodococcus oxybenzonivorans]|nr:hypothetical protein [Rhodococcus oxybenzonivorans]